MPVVCAGLRLQIDYAAGYVSELSGIGARLNGKFLYSLERNIKIVASSLGGGSDRDPVGEEQIRLGALPVHIHWIGRSGFPWCTRVYPCRQRDQLLPGSPI